jgi:hypothetical protein
MTKTSTTTTDTLDLRSGDWVEVRSVEEILATLDDNGTLDHLPFMPEMASFCGKRFQVYQRADRTCDTITMHGMRRMERTVHLTDSRCDGECHGGCHAGCFLFWKEAWLRRVTPDKGDLPTVDAPSQRGNGQATRDRAWLESTTVQGRTGDGEVRYRCQATELRNASHPLPWWKPGQYFHDIFVNGVPWTHIVRGVAGRTINKLRRRLTGRGYPDVAGPLDQTPVEDLGLQAGEWVIVKSREEIVATLDKNGKNRGMTFDGEMLPYCGKRFRVLRRVERIIEESTGRMTEPRGVSVILENVFCRSLFRRPCPRCIFSYWREIWLRRDPNQGPADGPSQLPVFNV